MLYELLTNCIPAPIIMRTLTRELMKVRYWVGVLVYATLSRGSFAVSASFLCPI